MTIAALSSVLVWLSNVYRSNCLARGRDDPGHLVLEGVLVVSAGVGPVGKLLPQLCREDKPGVRSHELQPMLGHRRTQRKAFDAGVEFFREQQRGIKRRHHRRIVLGRYKYGFHTHALHDPGRAGRSLILVSCNAASKQT